MYAVSNQSKPTNILVRPIIIGVVVITGAHELLALSFALTTYQSMIFNLVYLITIQVPVVVPDIKSVVRNSKPFCI